MKRTLARLDDTVTRLVTEERVTEERVTEERVTEERVTEEQVLTVVGTCLAVCGAVDAHPGPDGDMAAVGSQS